MANVVYALEANDDPLGIVECMARDKPKAARAWLRKIRETREAIATHPEMGELRLGFEMPAVRSFSVGNNVIFFCGTEGGIEVSRVIHGSRDMQNHVGPLTDTQSR